MIGSIGRTNDVCPSNLTTDTPQYFSDWIRAQCKRYLDKIAFEICGKQTSHAQIDRQRDLSATGFASLDFKMDEHISLMMETTITNNEVWFGLLKTGLVEVPVRTAGRGIML